jgi:hypothetical protein
MAVDQKKMQGQQSGMQQFDMNKGYPLDNRTYNLMQALVSKCESIDAYRQYAKDPGGEFFQKMIQHEWDEAQKMFHELRGSFK